MIYNCIKLLFQSYNNGYNEGVNDTKVGTATSSQVLSDYTFTNNNGIGLQGSMPNRGNLNWSGSNTTYSIPSGYYSGGTLDSRTSYMNGYNKGKEEGSSNVGGIILEGEFCVTSLSVSSGHFEDGSFSGTGSKSEVVCKFISQDIDFLKFKTYEVESYPWNCYFPTYGARVDEYNPSGNIKASITLIYTECTYTNFNGIPEGRYYVTLNISQHEIELIVTVLCDSNIGSTYWIVEETNNGPYNPYGSYRYHHFSLKLNREIATYNFNKDGSIIK